MILYLDSSALVKRYVAEFNAEQVGKVIAQAQLTGTVLIARVEVAAAFAKAARMAVLTLEEANACLDRFQRDWPHLVRLRIAEVTIARAAQLAWQHRLRGYDAVHLAAAILWQEALGELVTMATFDLRLWQAVIQVGMQAFPADHPALLEPLKIQDMNKSI